MDMDEQRLSREFVKSHGAPASRRVAGGSFPLGSALGLVGEMGELAHGKRVPPVPSQGSFVGWQDGARVPGARGLLS